MNNKIFVICSFLLFSISSYAQPYLITGNVKDASDTSALSGVNVILSSNKDSTNKTGSTTDLNGNFSLQCNVAGRYTLKFIYLGYKNVVKRINVTDNIAIGTISMHMEATELKGATVAGKQIRAEQNGDTTQFHADAYKTHPDATAEDLVTKMPGITSDNTGVKVNGEAVQQVYVDGKPFYGNDPTLSLKNLPAEVIDKIQVFDKLSDQATFTGFDDGNSQKTMNIITKSNKGEGVFGKVYSGYGTDDRYLAGGNLNIFHGDQRISILELSNNINQQNFGSQDLLGVMSGGGNGNRGGGGGMGGGNFSGGGGGGTNNFQVGSQPGNTITNSVGLNYSDVWFKKIKFTGSYFYNSTDNINNSLLTRNYFTKNDSTNIYNENDNSETKNANHRINMRLEYTVDSYNTIIFTPSINFQENINNSATFAKDSLGQFLASKTNNSSSVSTTGYNSNNNLLLQHKFKKPKRTISINFANSFNEKSGNGNYFSVNNFYTRGDSTKYNQNNTINNNGYTLGTTIAYTEPIGKKGQLMLNYSPSYTKNSADNTTYNFSDTTLKYTDVDTFLSNKYNNTYTTQKGGINYRIGDKKFNIMFGINYQVAELEGEQIFPYNVSIPRTFSSFLPTAFFNYRFANGRNLRIMYRTNTSAPSVTQLQNVVNISNPLLLTTGNSNLKQDFEQSLIIRYGLTKSKTAHNFFLYAYGNYISNYIANASYMPNSDSSFKGPYMLSPVIINKGSQLTMPVNIDGYWNAKSFITYSLPFEVIKSNLNLNGGCNYTRTPGLINNSINYSSNTIPTFGIVISSNISEKLDFTLAYTGNYNLVNNTVEKSGNNNFYNHTSSFKINYLFLKHFVFNTNITHNYYTAFSSTGVQSYFLWNAYLGYKMLKKQALEARISCYDILNQNINISRTVTETYIQNSNTQVLKQYFMFQLTYTIRNFKGAIPTENKPDRDNGEHNFRQPGGRGGM